MLYDREKYLGGLILLAAFIKGTDFDDVSLALKWYENQLKKLKNLKVVLGTEVDKDLVVETSPEVVILAPGSKWELPDIPGIHGSNVVTTGQLKEKAKGYLKYLRTEVMSSLTKIYVPVGKRAIVMGGDLKGLEATEFLVKRGRQVTLVEQIHELGEGMNEHLKSRFLPWLQAHDRITVYTGVTFNEITSQGLDITTDHGVKKMIEADTLIVIEKDKKNLDLFKVLKGEVSELYLIGDAKEDLNAWIHGAVHDGAYASFSV